MPGPETVFNWTAEVAYDLGNTTYSRVENWTTEVAYDLGNTAHSRVENWTTEVAYEVAPLVRLSSICLMVAWTPGGGTPGIILQGDHVAFQSGAPQGTGLRLLRRQGGGE